MRRVHIKRYESGSWEEREDVVAEEAFLELCVAGEPLGTLVCTSSQVRELVYGHLAGLGLVRTAQDVEEYREEWSSGEHVRVAVRLRSTLEKGLTKNWKTLLGSFPLIPAGLPQLSPRPLFSASGLLALPARILALAQGFQSTGALHSAALVDPTFTPLFFAEDLGRHNAVDKVIGAALLAQRPPGETLLYTTGRVGREVVLKALRAGIPVVASPGAPFEGAVALARHCRLGLVGFLRDRRFNLYSGEGWFTP